MGEGEARGERAPPLPNGRPWPWLRLRRGDGRKAVAEAPEGGVRCVCRVGVSGVAAVGPAREAAAATAEGGVDRRVDNRPRDSGPGGVRAGGGVAPPTAAAGEARAYARAAGGLPWAGRAPAAGCSSYSNTIGEPFAADAGRLPRGGGLQYPTICAPPTPSSPAAPTPAASPSARRRCGGLPRSASKESLVGEIEGSAAPRTATGEPAAAASVAPAAAATTAAAGTAAAAAGSAAPATLVPTTLAGVTAVAAVRALCGVYRVCPPGPTAGVARAATAAAAVAPCGTDAARGA